jgi:hypothetical protein
MSALRKRRFLEGPAGFFLMKSLKLQLALVLLAPSLAEAQSLSDAETLPKQTGGLIVNPGFGYGPGTLQRFGNGWQASRESLVADFDQIDLTNVIAGDQADLISRVIGKLGTTSFTAKQQAFAINFLAAYGVTDRLTVAAVLPFTFVRYELDASLTPFMQDPADPNDDDFKHSHFRVKNADQFTCPGGNFSISDPEDLVGREDSLLEDGGDTYQFNIADLNRALVSDCLGYRQVVDRFETRNGVVHGLGERTYSGFRDLGLAAKYQLYHSRYIHLGLIGYLIAPTGKPDRPNDLFDVKLGDGNWGGAVLGAMTIPLGDFSIGTSVGYEIELADSIEVRLSNVSFPEDLEKQFARGQISEKELLSEHIDEGSLIPIVTRYDQVEVKRKLGDNIYVYTSFNYQIFDWLSVGITLNFLHHFRDKVNAIGPRPEGAAAYRTETQARADIEQLAAENNWDAEEKEKQLIRALGETVERKKAAYGWHTVRGNLDIGFGISFNSVPLFLRGDFPFPIIAGIGINRFIAGQNLDTPEAISFQLAIPFITSLDIVDPQEYGYDDEVGGGLPWP